MAISLPKFRVRADQRDPRVVAAKKLHHLSRRIVAAVIDIDRLPRPSGRIAFTSR